MKLKPVKKLKPVLEEPKPVEKKKKDSKKSLPKDSYDPLFPPIMFEVSDTPSLKDPTKRVKRSLELSVKRAGDLGLPYVFMQMYQEAEIYTGYLKGKSVSFPLEMLYTVMENLEELDSECNKRKIE